MVKENRLWKDVKIAGLKATTLLLAFIVQRLIAIIVEIYMTTYVMIVQTTTQIENRKDSVKMFFKIRNMGCLMAIGLLLLQVTVGTWSVIEILSWFGKSIPTLANVVIGFFLGELTIPIALIGWLVQIVFGI